MVSAAVSGTIEGIREAEAHLLQTAHKDVADAKERVFKETESLTSIMRDSFDSAKEVGGEFSEEISQTINDTVADAKLEMTEMIVVTFDTVKQAVKKAINTGTEIDATVQKITRDATAKAMSEARFTANRARKVSEAVLFAAVDAAEESGSYVQEVTSGAAEGVREGLGIIINQTRESIAKSRKETGEFAAHELHEIKEDLEMAGDIFVATLRKLADRSGIIAKNILNEMAEDASKARSSLHELATKAAQTATQGLKELGSGALHNSEKAAHTISEEASELGSRMLSVAKGAAVGMWQGAKNAISHEDEKTEKKDS